MPAFLDTNVCLRYLLNDNAELSPRAARIIDGADDLFLTDVVIAEIGFVLLRFYQVPRSEVVDNLIALVRKTNIEVWHLDEDLVVEALMLCRPSGRVSFTDALLWAVARSTEGAMVYSFDKRFPSDGLTVRQDF